MTRAPSALPRAAWAAVWRSFGRARRRGTIWPTLSKVGDALMASGHETVGNFADRPFRAALRGAGPDGRRVGGCEARAECRPAIGYETQHRLLHPRPAGTNVCRGE